MPKTLSLARGAAPRALCTTTVTPVGTHRSPWARQGAAATIAVRTHNLVHTLPTKQDRVRTLVDGVWVLPDAGVLGGGDAPLPPAAYRNPTLRAKQARGETGCRNVATNPEPRVKGGVAPIVLPSDVRRAKVARAEAALVAAGDRRAPRSILALTVKPAGLANPPGRSPRHKPWIEVE